MSVPLGQLLGYAAMLAGAWLAVGSRLRRPAKRVRRMSGPERDRVHAAMKHLSATATESQWEAMREIAPVFDMAWPGLIMWRHREEERPKARHRKYVVGR